MKFSFKDATFILPSAWQQLEKDEKRVVFGGGDSVLMLQYFPLAKPPSVPDVNSMMGGFSKDNKVEYSLEDATIGGEFARVATSRLNDNRLQLAAVIARSSGVLAMIGMGPDDDMPLQIFKHVLDTLAFADVDRLIRYHHPDLGFSIGVPEGWQIAETDDFPMHVFAPEDQDYRASLGFMVMASDEPIDIVGVAKYLQQQAQQDLDGFLVDQEQPALLDGRSAFMDRYYWNAQGVAFSQFNTFISHDAMQIVRAHGYCPRMLEAKYVPLFIKILMTIKFDA